jgi:hypothetical protein
VGTQSKERANRNVVEQREMSRRFSLAIAALILTGAATPLPGRWTTGLPLPVARSEVAVATIQGTI